MMADLAGSFAGAVSIAPNLLTAFTLGSLVGLERQWRQRYTGVTTYALVALGAASFASIPSLLDAVGDPTRIGGQVVTGIGFLGAGLIMRDGLSVRGLSTAATVWATGAIGVMAGYGLLVEAAEAAVFILLANTLLRRVGVLAETMPAENGVSERYYVIELKGQARNEGLIRALLLQAVNARKLRLHGLESHHIQGGEAIGVEAIVHSTRNDDALVERVVGDLILSPHVSSASWTATTSPD